MAVELGVIKNATDQQPANEDLIFNELLETAQGLGSDGDPGSPREPASTLLQISASATDSMSMNNSESYMPQMMSSIPDYSQHVSDPIMDSRDFWQHYSSTTGAFCQQPPVVPNEVSHIIPADMLVDITLHTTQPLDTDSTFPDMFDKDADYVPQDPMMGTGPPDWSQWLREP